MAFDAEPLAHQITIPSDLRAARDVEEQILQAAEKHGYRKENRFAVRLALEEAIVNAHKHGNCGDATKKITISYDVNANRVIIRVRDEGDGFEPYQVPDPTAAERISLPSGRGLMLMRAYVDEVTYNEQGNEVRLVKNKKT